MPGVEVTGSWHNSLAEGERFSQGCDKLWTQVNSSPPGDQHMHSTTDRDLTPEDSPYVFHPVTLRDVPAINISAGIDKLSKGYRCRHPVTSRVDIRWTKSCEWPSPPDITDK